MAKDDVNVFIGKRLRQGRRSAGMTQTRLAESIGVTFQQVQKYECGASQLSAARLWLCAQAVNVPVTYFFNGLTAQAVRGGSETVARAGRIGPD